MHVHSMIVLPLPWPSMFELPLTAVSDFKQAASANQELLEIVAEMLPRRYPDR